MSGWTILRDSQRSCERQVSQSVALFRPPTTSTEHKIDCQHETEESRYMIPLQLLPLKENIGNDTEDHEGDNLLDNLELHEGEGTSVALKTQTIGRYLTAVFQKGYEP